MIYNNPFDNKEVDILSVNKYIDRITEYPDYIIEGGEGRIYTRMIKEVYIESISLDCFYVKDTSEKKIIRGNRFSEILSAKLGITVNGKKKYIYNALLYINDVAMMMLLGGVMNEISRAIRIYSERYSLDKELLIDTYFYKESEPSIYLGSYSYKNYFKDSPRKDVYERIKKHSYNS